MDKFIRKRTPPPEPVDGDDEEVLEVSPDGKVTQHRLTGRSRNNIGTPTPLFAQLEQERRKSPTWGKLFQPVLTRKIDEGRLLCFFKCIRCDGLFSPNNISRLLKSHGDCKGQGASKRHASGPANNGGSSGSDTGCYKVLLVVGDQPSQAGRHPPPHAGGPAFPDMPQGGQPAGGQCQHAPEVVVQQPRVPSPQSSCKPAAVHACHNMCNRT